jgi:hypothetical protein
MILEAWWKWSGSVVEGVGGQRKAESGSEGTRNEEFVKHVKLSREKSSFRHGGLWVHTQILTDLAVVDTWVVVVTGGKLPTHVVCSGRSIALRCGYYG